MTITYHELAKLDVESRAALLRRSEADLGEFLDAARPIVERVRDEGDAALIDFTRRFDRAEVPRDGLRAHDEDFDRAFATLEPAVVEAIRFAVDNVRRFHEAQKPEAMWFQEVYPGAFAGDRTAPISSVACYVPRGKGAFPSVTVMTAVPAVVAGVPRIAVLTPPGPDGSFDAATLVAARTAGVTEVYRVGGAQAVAAVAFGTETVPRVDKIVGPGSPFVVAAKRLLADRIDTGLPAGPSESIILADSSANGRIAALDLVIESEHGPDSSAFLVTDSQAVADAARAAIPKVWSEMGEQRVAFSQAVLGGPRGGILLAADWGDAVDFVNAYAPEHLEILGAEPFRHLGRIINAGEILLGESTPITLGNFVLGPNAVLPTSGAARTWSPLSVHDFMKRTSVAYVTEDGYRPLAEQARVLARYEGFDAHGLSVSDLRTRFKAR